MNMSSKVIFINVATTAQIRNTLRPTSSHRTSIRVVVHELGIHSLQRSNPTRRHGQICTRSIGREGFPSLESRAMLGERSRQIQNLLADLLIAGLGCSCATHFWTRIFTRVVVENGA